MAPRPDPLHADPFRSRELVVPAGLHGARLDRALAELLEGVSRARVQELIRDGGVRVEGVPATRPSAPVNRNDRVELASVPRSRVRSGAPGLDDGPLAVVFEDEHLAVVDKPSGMVTHPSTVVRGGTVSERAVARWGRLPAPQGEDRPGIVHRLDAETSGLLLVAKTSPAADELVRMFRDREVEKTYTAVVFGEPRFDSDWIEAPIGRAPKRPDRMAVVEEGRGREARTFYETRARRGGFGGVRCRPVTGRTHQIRVHLASIGHPIVGDRVYRGRRGLSRALPPDTPPAPRLLLHARRLELDHPVTGERLRLEAGPPADLSAWLDWLGP